MQIGYAGHMCCLCKHFCVKQWIFPTNFCELHERAVVKFYVCDRFEPKEDNNVQHVQG